MVAEELNITRAAERLYISQQSLSSHISNMERELNVKLFTRSPKLALTYAGDQLVQTATQIIDLYSQYLSKVGDINRHYLGVLRVGISHTCGLALLPDILPRFREEFPMVDCPTAGWTWSSAFSPSCWTGWRPSPSPSSGW